MNTNRRQNLQIKTPVIEQVDGTQVVLLTDTDEALFDRSAGDYSIFDAVGAFQIAKPLLADRFDFVAFAIDIGSGIQSLGDYHIPVFNDISGLGYERPGNPGSMAEPEVWASDRLRACLVVSHKPTSATWRYLHELGHYWCSYVTFNDVERGIDHSCELLNFTDKLQGMYHWGEQFDDAFSPMDYDMTRWIERTDGRFEKESFLKGTSQNDTFFYCPLDLYLMGLLPAVNLKSVRVLRNCETTGEKEPTTGNEIFTATPVNISFDSISKSMGARVKSQKEPTSPFRLAFVAVSREAESGRNFARDLEVFRVSFEKQFQSATGKRAALETRLSSTG